MTICRIQVLPAAAADASSQRTVDGLVVDSDCVCRVDIRADRTTAVRLAKSWRLGMQIGMINGLK
jgi:hypothetical protein